MSDKPAMNTDRELWRERPDDFYADSIHVTARSGIGINCGGNVIVRPLREWHRLANSEANNTRQHAAIHLRVPDSGTDWLDDMIRQSLRQDFAKAALTGVCANSALRQDTSPEPYARVARGLADAALAELEKKGGG